MFGISGIHWKWEQELYVPDLWTLLDYVKATRIRVHEQLTGVEMRLLADEAVQHGKEILFTLGSRESAWCQSVDLYRAHVDELNLVDLVGHKGVWGYDAFNEPPRPDPILIEVAKFGSQYVKSVDPSHSVTVGQSSLGPGVSIEDRRLWTREFAPYVDVIDHHIYWITNFIAGTLETDLAIHFDEVMKVESMGKPLQLGECGCWTETFQLPWMPDPVTFSEADQLEYFIQVGKLTRPRKILVYAFKLIDSVLLSEPSPVGRFGLFRRETAENMNIPKLATTEIAKYVTPEPLIMPLLGPLLFGGILTGLAEMVK